MKKQPTLEEERTQREAARLQGVKRLIENVDVYAPGNWRQKLAELEARVQTKFSTRPMR